MEVYIEGLSACNHNRTLSTMKKEVMNWLEQAEQDIEMGEEFEGKSPLKDLLCYIWSGRWIIP